MPDRSGSGFWNCGARRTLSLFGLNTYKKKFFFLSLNLDKKLTFVWTKLDVHWRFLIIVQFPNENLFSLVVFYKIDYHNHVELVH